MEFGNLILSLENNRLEFQSREAIDKQLEQLRSAEAEIG
jgi:hypothetical protein